MILLPLLKSLGLHIGTPVLLVCVVALVALKRRVHESPSARVRLGRSDPHLRGRPRS